MKNTSATQKSGNLAFQFELDMIEEWSASLLPSLSFHETGTWVWIASLLIIVAAVRLSSLLLVVWGPQPPSFPQLLIVVAQSRVAARSNEPSTSLSRGDRVRTDVASRRTSLILFLYPIIWWPWQPPHTRLPCRRSFFKKKSFVVNLLPTRFNRRELRALFGFESGRKWIVVA